MSKNTKGILYLIITVFFFSTYEVVGKNLSDRVNPFEINLIRFLTGGIILFVILFIKGDYKIGLKDFYRVLLLGVINVVISMSLLQLSLYLPGSKASIAAVVFSSNPIFVAIFAYFMDKEKMTVWKVMGLVTGLAGIGAIFINRNGSADWFKSLILALLSAISFAAYTVLGRRVSVKISSLKMNCYSFIAGSICLMPVLLFNSKLSSILNAGQNFRPMDLKGIIEIIYISVFVTGLAYITYFKGLEIMGASTGSLVFFAKPVLASIIAVIFLNEQIGMNMVVGTLLVAAGITIVVRSSKAEVRTTTST